MNKSAFLAVVIWTTGLGSASALVVAVRRPAVAVAPVTGLVDPPRTLAEAPPPPPLAVESTIEVAPVVVTVAESRHRTVPRELAQMRCGPWQGMVQGPETAEVRRCD
jgi:hypothetical protein